MKIYQVQAQVSGVTKDGWHSSRQVPTINVGARDAHEAAKAVSHLAWDMSQAGYREPRHTYAAVCPMMPNRDGDMVPFPGIWVRVTYRHGGIETVTGDTYGSVKYVPTEGE